MWGVQRHKQPLFYAVQMQCSTAQSRLQPSNHKINARWFPESACLPFHDNKIRQPWSGNRQHRWCGWCLRSDPRRSGGLLFNTDTANQAWNVKCRFNTGTVFFFSSLCHCFRQPRTAGKSREVRNLGSSAWRRCLQAPETGDLYYDMILPWKEKGTTQPRKLWLVPPV